jgi:hypothetical protein
VHSLRSIALQRLPLMVGLILLQLSGTAAHAASITNRDEVDRKVTIIEGDRTTDHVLQPSQALNDVCAKGCTIRLDDGEDDEYMLEADDVVSIEDGSLYYDRPDAPAAPAAPPEGSGRSAGKG